MTKHSTSVLVAIAALAYGMDAGAVPLSAMPTGPGPHYFGYFGSAFRTVGLPSDGGQCHDGDYIACTEDHANVAHIVSWDALDPSYCGAGPKFCDTLTLLEEVRSRGMGAALSVPVPPNCGADGHMKPEWTTYVNDLRTYVIPTYGNTIISFYLWDEPRIETSTVRSCIAEAATSLRQAFPTIHRQVTLDYLALSPNVDWTLPADVDWAGYDHYTPPPGAFIPVGTGVAPVPYYVARLKEIVRKSAHSEAVKLVLFPVGWQDSRDGSFDAQAALLRRVEREISLAENDPDFVMIMPFLYQDNGSWAGVNSIPMARHYYQALGKHVTMTNTPRLAFPSSVIAASSAIAGGGVENAFDVDRNTMWNSGGYAPAWLSAGFLDPIVVTSVSLRAAMSPDGHVAHRLIGYSSIGANTLTSFAGAMWDDWVWAPAVSQVSGGMLSVVVDTTESPSWVGWRTFDIYTSGTTRVYGYPVATSGTYPGQDGLYIMDGDPNTMWNSGGFGSASSPQSITLDLGQSQTISHVDLLVAQSPEGPTTHELWGGPSESSLAPLSTLSEFTSDNEWISFVGTFSNVRYLAVKTTASPSWVGWREIGIFR